MSEKGLVLGREEGLERQPAAGVSEDWLLPQLGATAPQRPLRPARSLLPTSADPGLGSGGQGL